MASTKEQTIYELAEELDAILLLEYHNKNHLSGDDKSRNEAKRNIVGGIKSIAKIMGQ